MYTLGYSFRPWTESEAIADGASILKYICEDTAERRIDSAGSVSATVCCEPRGRLRDGTLERGGRAIAATDETSDLSCNFLLACAPATTATTMATRPIFAGQSSGLRGRSYIRSTGPRIIDYAGKRVVVIGSGATAVTLVPAMVAAAPRT